MTRIEHSPIANDEQLALLAGIVKSHGETGISAAEIGQHWRTLYPTKTYPKPLSALVAKFAEQHAEDWAVEEAGSPRVRLVPKSSVPAAASLNAAAIGVPAAAGAAETAVTVILPSVGMKQPVYEALIYERSVPCWVDRQTGAILAEGKPGAVKIEAVPASIQKQWARSFLGDNNLSGLESELDKPRWYFELDRALAHSADPESAGRWKRVRTAKAVEWLGAWCRREGVPLNPLLSEPPSVGHHAEARRACGPSPREIILRVVAGLDTRALLALRLPAGAVLAAAGLIPSNEVEQGRTVGGA
ncbi:MAG: hypothetical protein J0L61_02305 [Planctomycetes bacterium]|nr:hypothetical protein [Planctomycetota bacterium]